MITYQRERLPDIQVEMEPILQKHWEEVAMYKDHVPLDPDWDRYHMLDRSDALHIITARDDGELVGYFIGIVTQGLHYLSTRYAVNDIVFIHDEYRHTGMGLALFQYAEVYFYKLGVQVMTIHMKTDLPFDSLCKGLGYDYAERLYTKYIGSDS